MGFYIRKAVRVGPLRFNLSTSGIGVSAGIKGFRIGTGPRGHYVHMGRGGIYFRKSLHPAGERTNARAGTPPFPPRSIEPADPQVPPGTVAPLHAIDSGSVDQMVDASSAELLREMNDKKRKIRFLPGAVALSVIAVLVLSAAGLPAGVVALVGTSAVGLCWLVFTKDQLRKTTVILYELEPEVEAAYEALHDAFGVVRSCARVWHIEARGEVRDRKYHAGASEVVKRTQIALTTGAPPFVKTNLEVPLVPVGRQVLAFLPDRLVVFESAAVGAIAYPDLRLRVTESRCVEEETLPRDATVVGRTWRYANKKGGPDRRFTDNREIPICAYERIHLSSASGLNEVLQVSQRGASAGLSQALAVLQALHTDDTTPAAEQPHAADGAVRRPRG